MSTFKKAVEGLKKQKDLELLKLAITQVESGSKLFGLHVFDPVDGFEWTFTINSNRRRSYRRKVKTK